MNAMAWYLPIIWAAIIATAVAMYVVLDGFDLGLGILFPTTRDEAARDTMMNSVAPFWDGNETWLVLGGGGLWTAFPMAYAIIMPALYIPVILMLLALIFRGVAFEFRWVAKPSHRIWDSAFAGGSIVAAFAQGLILGGLIQGITVKDGQFAGGALDWFTPFSVMCGFGLMAGYALLAACWTMMKTEGDTAAHAQKLAGPLLICVGVFAAAVSLWTPLQYPRIAERWFSDWHLLYLWPLPLATAALGLFVWRKINDHAGAAAFFGTIGIFLLCYLGLAISTFPYIAPPSITVWEASSVPATQIFTLIGVMFLLPLILAYTVFIYWTFRGPIKAGEGYH